MYFGIFFVFLLLILNFLLVYGISITNFSIILKNYTEQSLIFVSRTTARNQIKNQNISLNSHVISNTIQQQVTITKSAISLFHLIGRSKNPIGLTIDRKSRFTSTTKMAVTSPRQRSNTTGFTQISTHEQTIEKETKRESSNNITEAFKQTHFMTISGNGRLGNQMFEFASMLGIAARHGYTPFITPRHGLNKVFDIPESRDIRLINSKSIGEVNAGWYDVNLEHLSHNSNWTLQGYYQSWKYFNNVKNLVIKSFKFKDSFLQYAKDVLKRFNPEKRPTVSIHIRRGDMNSGRELARGYSVASLEYVKKAMDYFRKNISSPIFFVVSDDRGWVTRYLKGNDVVLTGNGSPGGDMAILANCNHSIVSTGTYGWWGAWLAGGQVIYYKNFPTPGSWLDKRYRKNDYYPPHWLGMV